MTWASERERGPREGEGGGGWAGHLICIRDVCGREIGIQVQTSHYRHLNTISPKNTKTIVNTNEHRHRHHDFHDDYIATAADTVAEQGGL